MAEIISIEVKELRKSAKNVRSKHSKEAVKKMAASILSSGVINPPTVALNGSGRYEVVAGQLRVAGAEEAGLESIDVRVLEGEWTEAQLVELSLSENVQRQEMDDLERFVAFDKLARSGKTVAEIASTFSMKEIEVRRSLAIGSLPKKIIKLAQDDKIWSGALEALTVATKEQLDRYLNMEARNRPKSGWEINTWLQKKAQRIPIAHALFDVAEYKGAMLDDLFADEDQSRCFADSDEFWKLQKPMIDKAVEDLKGNGWPVVRVDEFHEWNYKKASKAKGGKAFVAVLKTGQVIIKTGLLPYSASSPARSGKTQAQPELSGAMSTYCQAHRHVAIQDALLHDHVIALALAITLITTATRGWRIEREEFKSIRNEKHLASITASRHRQDCVIEYKELRKEFGVQPGSRDASQVLRAVSEYDRDSLLLIFSTIVSERLSMPWMDEGGKLDDTLAELLGLDQVDAWKPDDAFWSGIRSRAAMIGIVNELVPTKIARSNLSVPLKDLRSLAKKFAGIGRMKAWRPKWLRFPAQAYAKKHRLNFVVRRAPVEKLKFTGDTG